MKTNIIAFAGVGLLVLFAFTFVSVFEIRLASAQVDATSSGSVENSLPTTTPSVDAASTTTDTSTSTDSVAPAPKTSGDSTPTAGAVDTSPATSSSPGLVEVQLQCSMSYTSDLYDTPSGHLDPYVAPETATTTDTTPHVIGQQAWTQCHDNQGHVHEFKITAAEYKALWIRGMPQESVMETPDQAALDSFTVLENSSSSAGTF